MEALSEEDRQFLSRMNLAETVIAWVNAKLRETYHEGFRDGVKSALEVMRAGGKEE